MQSNRTEATLFASSLGRGDDSRGTDDRAARVIGVMQRNSIAVNSGNLQHMARLVNVVSALQAPGVSSATANAVRSLATAHADWSRQLTRTVGNEQPTRTPGWANRRQFTEAFGRIDDGTRFVSPNPPGSGPAQASPSPTWSDKQISDGVDKLLRDRGVDAPAVSELMKSLLLQPALTVDQRALAVNRTNQSVVSNSMRVRELLGSGNTNLRIALAERIGMPFSAVVARIHPEGDQTLALRVMNTINPSHRENVAELLLGVQVGSPPDALIYRSLDTIFRGGDPYASATTLANVLGVTPSSIKGSVRFLQSTFGGERTVMLRTMGFSFEQILAMNPVGAELSKRFDPALGTYSPTQIKLRTQKNLPNTREQAAERLLRVGVGNVDGIRSLSYRNWLAVGLVSDKPWSLPSDVARSFATIVPNGDPKAGGADLHQAFRVVQVLLGREIPRGARLDLMDRTYRHEINLLMLQTFGLGATRVGSGRLEAIPTDFKVSDWPSPAEAGQQGRKEPRTDQANEEVTWQQLLPLLQRHTVRLK
jgi:hypothetical protein